MKNLAGLSLLAGRPASPSEECFEAENPSTGEKLPPHYHAASGEDVREACAAACEAFPVYRSLPDLRRVEFLREIALAIENLGEDLLDRFVAESGLPAVRAESERARTCGQLRLFAGLLESGAWNEPRRDPALPDRKPLPRPALHYLLRPVGPVAVFGPANFPLAFTVAGGDTASALAAGCPVVVKAHSGHPGTSELVGRAVVHAAQNCGMPHGVFSLLFGSGRKVGTALVSHPAIQAVGFTGSQEGGQHLWKCCQARPDPIPFFGELSSINPVFLLPGALAARPGQIAAGLHGSLTLGCGQFCTNPGIVFFLADSPGVKVFLDELVSLLGSTASAPMLNRATRASYDEGLRRVGGVSGVLSVVQPPGDSGPGGCHASPALFSCDAATFCANSEVLGKEIFGPATLLVSCRTPDELAEAVSLIEGQLTATFHAEPEDIDRFAGLFQRMETKAGRLVFGGFPTGVEVCDSIVHGGPWPATTDGRFTSVGTAAIRRWLRPVCWQNAPEAVLPAAFAARP